MLNTNPSRPPAAATVDLGYGPAATCGLHGRPAAAPITRPGTVTLNLGRMASGRMFTLNVTRLEWLDYLESAIQAARAAAIVQGGMAVTP